MTASHRLAPVSEEELLRFVRSVYRTLGIDLRAYKPMQLRRRLTNMLIRHRLDDLDALAGAIATDPARAQSFRNGLTITVTEFFRDPPRFADLKTTILPALLDRFPRLKVWSAGCSIGAELYSVGMILDELRALDRCELVGTDINPATIERAKQGRYLAHEVRALPDSHRRRYFRTVSNELVLAHPELQERCRFVERDLLASPSEANCHLILSRNVLIYFEPEAKRSAYEQFRRSLEPGGILFTGRSERIVNCRSLGYRQRAPFFYEALPEA